MFRNTPVVAVSVLACLALTSCSDKKEGAPSNARFAAVAKPADNAAVGKFCDQGEAINAEATPYQPPPTRPIGGVDNKASSGEGKWLWVNVWATWCTPCIQEMGLLGRWKDALEKDGTPVAFELLSIDAKEDEDKLKAWTAKKTLAGPVQWIRNEDDFGPWLSSMGVQGASAIPIHVLVDPKGSVQCVRLGAVHEQDYGTVRSILNRVKT